MASSACVIVCVALSKYFLVPGYRQLELLAVGNGDVAFLLLIVSSSGTIHRPVLVTFTRINRVIYSENIGLYRPDFYMSVSLVSCSLDSRTIY